MFEFVESCKTIDELENILEEKNYDWEITDFPPEDEDGEFDYYTYAMSAEVDEIHVAVSIYDIKTKKDEIEILERKRLI